MADDMMNMQNEGGGMPQGGNVAPEGPKHHGGPGKLLLIAGSVALLVLVMAFMMRPQVSEAPSGDGADVPVNMQQEEPPLSDSNDLDDIESDLDSTDLDSLDEEFSDIERELGS